MRCMLIGIMVILVAREAASSCISRRLSSDLERTNTVFVGRLVSLKSVADDNGEKWILCEFDKYYSWKGKSESKVIVRTHSESVTSWRAREWTPTIGTVYLVFGHEVGGVVYTSHCARTKPLEHAYFERFLLPAPTLNHIDRPWKRMRFDEFVQAVESEKAGPPWKGRPSDILSLSYMDRIYFKSLLIEIVSGSRSGSTLYAQMALDALSEFDSAQSRVRKK